MISEKELVEAKRWRPCVSRAKSVIPPDTRSCCAASSRR
jgi:hypothetical protein